MLLVLKKSDFQVWFLLAFSLAYLCFHASPLPLAFLLPSCCVSLFFVALRPRPLVSVPPLDLCGHHAGHAARHRNDGATAQRRKPALPQVAFLGGPDAGPPEPPRQRIPTGALQRRYSLACVQPDVRAAMCWDALSTCCSRAVVLVARLGLQCPAGEHPVCTVCTRLRLPSAIPSLAHWGGSHCVGCAAGVTKWRGKCLPHCAPVYKVWGGGGRFPLFAPTVLVFCLLSVCTGVVVWCLWGGVLSCPAPTSPSCPPGQVVFRQGEPGDTFYIIVHGEVEVSVSDSSGAGATAASAAASSSGSSSPPAGVGYGSGRASPSGASDDEASRVVLNRLTTGLYFVRARLPMRAAFGRALARRISVWVHASTWCRAGLCLCIVGHWAVRPAGLLWKGVHAVRACCLVLCRVRSRC